MTEKALLKQLKSLRDMNPDNSWQKSERDILLSQILNSGAKELKPFQKLLIDSRSFVMTLSRPALALGSLLLVLAATSLFSYQAFTKTRPDDSLYIARIISEKAKLNTVLDHAERDKLAVKFAADHAEAITEVLASTDTTNAEQVAKLNDSFSKEINTVRSRIASMKKVSPGSSNDAAPASATNSEADMLMTAGNGKDNSGIQVVVNPDEADVASATKTEVTATETTPIIDKASSSEDVASSSPEASSSEEISDQSNQILDEAQTLFDNKDYNSALDKLKEVKELIK